MNISAIRNLPQPQPQIESQQSFRGKAPRKFLEVITEKRPLSNYTEEYLLPEIAKVIDIAKTYGKPVKVAQLKGEKLLVNVGTLTKVIDSNKTSVREFPKVLIDLIKANSYAEDCGLQAGLSYLA